MKKPEVVTTPLDIVAIQVLAMVISPEARTTQEGIEQAYELARTILDVRQKYEQVAVAEEPKMQTSVQNECLREPAGHWPPARYVLPVQIDINEIAELIYSRLETQAGRRVIVNIVKQAQSSKEL